MQIGSLWKALLGSLWVIVLAIVMVMALFYAFGKVSVSEDAVSTVTIIPSNRAQQSEQYSGNEVLLAANQFASITRSWMTSPDFTKAIYERAAVPVTSDIISSQPLVFSLLQSPLAYRVSKSTNASQFSEDRRILEAVTTELQERTNQYNLVSDTKLSFVIEGDEPTYVKKDNTASLMKLTAPLLGLFAGIFVIVVRESLRRRNGSV